MALGNPRLEPRASAGRRLAPPHRAGARLSRFRFPSIVVLTLASATHLLGAQEAVEPTDSPIAPTSTRLTVGETQGEIPLVIPLPAHVAPRARETNPSRARPGPGRRDVPAPSPQAPTRAEYLLPDRDQKPAITPELANLNLPADLEITATDTGEKILLPAGTYRQILQIPIDSPAFRNQVETREHRTLPIVVEAEPSRYAEPEKKPIWVRFEALEKIKIGEKERRGGIDLPSHGPKELGPRVWYAKSETADPASSVFYFIFGGLGYATANLAGWSAGNTREIPGDFEYRLIRR